MLPSERGANRWGHWSEYTCHLLVDLSHHIAKGRPIMVAAVGPSLSRSFITAIGYHALFQSNFWLSLPCCSSGTLGFSSTAWFGPWPLLPNCEALLSTDCASAPVEAKTLFVKRGRCLCQAHQKGRVSVLASSSTRPPSCTLPWIHF
jgi:hypothetical protein